MTDALIMKRLEREIAFECEGMLCPNPAIFAAVCANDNCRAVELLCGSHLNVAAVIHRLGITHTCQECGWTAVRFSNAVTVHPVHLRNGRVA